MDSGASPWSEIQRDALARGELVYAMNEGWATLSEGVGYALSWIGLRAWDGDFPFVMQEKPVEGPVCDGGSAEAGRDQAHRDLAAPARSPHDHPAGRSFTGRRS